MDGQIIRYPGWKIIRTIGKGSFGCVYEVEKEGEFGAVTHSALKVISIPETDAEIKAYRDDGYDEASLTKLFRTQVEDITAEFGLMSKLKGDSHIVSYEDHMIVQHENDPGYDIFIRMELLTSLPDYINRAFPDNRVPDAAVAALGADICRALERCGRHGIIHRDVKPQNIFVNEEGDFKLGDFGIAKTSDHTTKATKTGTYGYMAPEVYRSLPYNASVDIYSLGMVLYWMLNERRGPFLPLPPAIPRPSQSSDALERRMHGEPLPPPKHGSEALKRIVLKACAFDPKDRYADSTEMKRDLEALTGTVAAGFIPPVKKPDPVESAQPGTPDEKTVGIFTPALKLHTDPAEGKHALKKQTGETTRIETVPNAEQQTPFTPVQSETPDEKTVGIFRTTAKPPKPQPPKPAPEPEPEPEPASEPATEPEKPAADRKDVDGRKKQKWLMIAAAAILLMAAAIVLIVVLAGRGKSEQQAETPTSAPIETPEPKQTPEPEPTEEPMPEPELGPAVVFQDATFEKAFRKEYGLTGTIYQLYILVKTRLDLSDCGLTDISDIAAFRALEELDVRNNQISDISALSGLTNLTSLSLDGNQISDISALSGLMELRWLYLEGNQISDISALSGLTELRWLYLKGNNKLSKQQIDDLQEKLPNCYIDD